jgi:hypothetical protein
MTLVNLASLAIFVAAITMGRFGYRRNFRPMDTRSLLTARVVTEDIGGDKDSGARDRSADWEDRLIMS